MREEDLTGNVFFSFSYYKIFFQEIKDYAGSFMTVVKIVYIGSGHEVHTAVGIPFQGSVHPVVPDL
jgi:hypothetical protein